MNRLKTIVFGSLVAGSLIISAGPTMADWHWSAQDHRWNRRADLRSDYNDLAQARRQLDYDIHHHASRKKIARDDQRVQELLNDIHQDRRDLHW